MKKITTTFFLLMAMVLLLPTEIKAWNDIQIHSNFKGWGQSGSDFNLNKVDNDDNTRSGEFDATGLTNGTTYYFVLQNVYNGSATNTYKGGFEYNFNNTGEQSNNLSDSGDDLKLVHNSKYKSYKFYATWNNGWTLKITGVEGGGSETSDWGNLSLCSNAGQNNWNSDLHDLLTQSTDGSGNPVYTKTITVNDYMGSSTQNNQFRFRFWSNGKNQWISPTEYTQITLGGDLKGSVTGTISNSKDYYWYVPTTASGKTLETITIKATYNKSTEQWTIEATGVAPADEDLKAFYLIIPEKNVGNTARVAHPTTFTVPAGHVAFKLQANRERNTDPTLGSTVVDALNKDLTSFNLKIDGEKGRQLRWYEDEIKFKICDEQGKYYRYSNNETEEFNLADDNHGACNLVDGYGSCNTTYTNDIDANSVKYFRIHKHNYAATAKSLTFMFSSKNAQHTYHPDKNNLDNTVTLTNGNVVNGDKTSEEDNRVNKVTGNLIVAFLQSRGPGSDYYNNVIGGSSGLVYIVGKTSNEGYKCELREDRKMTKRYWLDNKSALNLSELGITDETATDSVVYECTVKKSGDWNNFFMSFSAGNKIDGSNAVYNSLLRPSVQNQMDAQALEGGIFYHNLGTDGYNDGQAINPALTADQKDRYVSYKIYFNATYSTYRIQFFDGFYIGGPAVNNGDEGYGSTQRIPMTREIHHGTQCYTHTGKFKQGERFAFFTNEASYNNNYSEDEHNMDNFKNNNGVWTVQAPTDNDRDYPFYNAVKFNNNVPTTATDLGDGNEGILWTLPDGEYTVRFYYGGVFGPNGMSPKENGNALYTVDKKIKTKNITIASNGKNYGGWNAFSDDCAMWIPDGVKAYYAYGVETKDGKNVVKLRELKDGYIPAHCGVLLYNDKVVAPGAVRYLNYSPLPDDYTKTLTTDDNLLQDCSTASVQVPQTVEKEGKTYYNYYFTYIYQKNGINNNVPLNFWKVLENSYSGKNSTYLTVDTKITPLEYNVQEGNYYIAEPATVANSKGAYCLLFSIDDVDNNETTGITVIRPATDKANDNVWYNMQGMRVSKPITAGIYINNGKKVVIK